jgi:ubiquinol-cytochrome c reductase cytochrome b subunit
VTYFLRVAVFVAPVIAFIVTKRICIGLQRADEERLLHGAESGVLVRDPSGSYSETHRPISTDEAFTLTSRVEPLALSPVESEDDLSAGQRRVEQVRRRATRFYFIDNMRKPTRAELEEAAAHQAHGDSDVHELEDGHGNGNGHHAITAGSSASGSQGSGSQGSGSHGSGSHQIDSGH